VGHDIVAQLAFELGHALEVDPLARGPHGGDGSVWNIDTEIALLLRERDPQVAPDERLAMGRKDPRYFRRGVAVYEGVGVTDLGQRWPPM
jgi:hypothetical protein